MEDSIKSETNSTQVVTVESIREIVSKMLGNRNNAWWKSKFLVASKLKAYKQFKADFEGACNWPIESHIRLLYRYDDFIREHLLPGAYSVNQPLAKRVDDLLYGIKRYVEETAPHLQ